MFERIFFCFFRSHTTNRYTNQPTSRVQFLCACRWHRKPFASLFRFCISKLLHTFIILDCINFSRVILNNMQISHQHKLIIFSQIGSYCRVDSFGDIPGQVVSLFDLWIWTLKSALSLYSGLSCLVVKKFPCEGEHTVREADGQNKLWFSQVFRMLFVAMTLSHNFPKMRKYVHAFTATLLQSSSILSWVDVATIFLFQIFSAVLFDDYIYTLNLF